LKIQSSLLFLFSLICVSNAYAIEPSNRTPPSTKEIIFPTLEEKYIKTRDDYIHQFSKELPAAERDDSKALGELEQQIPTIVGPINIIGFPKQGKINLETLLPELGFGQVDGLKFVSDQESLFVTTEILLKNYLVKHPKLPKKLKNLSKSEDFYRLVFHSDAAVTCYTEVPVKKKDQSFAYAFLGVSTQYIGHILPTEIYVFVSKENKILLVCAKVIVEIPDIPECRKEWEKFDKKKANAFELYRSSELKNKKALDESFRYENQGFEAYHHCYSKNAKNQQFFISLKRQAQSIVDRLQKE
jgi:hypothetical protein